MTLALLLNEDNIVMPFVEDNPLSVEKNKMVERLIDDCNSVVKEIHNHLEDVEEFYKTESEWREAANLLINAPHQEHFAVRLNDEEMKGIDRLKELLK